MNPRKVVKKLIPKTVFEKIEPTGHLAEAYLRHAKAGFPGKGLNVIGVTGTNGKTSTSFIIHKMLQTAGYKTGIMTTVAYGIDDDIKNQVQHYTNVPVPELLRRLKWMKSQKIDWLVLESTSQGLVQHRLYGIPYSVAVLTNLTHEHLDYHRTFERYRNAKRLLFKRANKNRQGLQTGVINLRDPSAKYFAADIKNPVFYDVEPTSRELEEWKGEIPNIELVNPDTPENYMYAQNVKMTPTYSTFTAVSGDEEYKIRINIPGGFYVQNALAAVCVGRAIGLTKQQIEDGIAALQGVEGRMNAIDEGQDFDVIVDYAHTPDSFEKLFKDLKPVVKGKLIVMFGSAGRRDEAKRAVQGELAGKYCDEVVITEEDDRDIDGQEIMQEIAAEAAKSGKVKDKDLFLVHDRAEAIAFTLKRAQKGDTVLLLGKGHEKTIERADGEHPWDEVGTARKVLKNLK